MINAYRFVVISILAASAFTLGCKRSKSPALPPSDLKWSAESFCGYCGRLMFRKKNGEVESTAILETDLSKWLHTHRPMECEHKWQVISSFNSDNNINIDLRLDEITALNDIKRIESLYGVDETTKNLDIYFGLLEVPDPQEKYRLERPKAVSHP